MKGIIFDLDGVICSTDVYHYEAWRDVVADLGIRIGPEINAKLRGVSRMEGLDRILNGQSVRLSGEEKEALAVKKNELYKELLENMSEADLSDEVRDTLRVLKARGILMAIGSSSKNAGLVLDKIGLGHFFDAVSDGNGIKNAKPDPEVFLRAADMLGLEAGDCLVVEDACSGIDAAVRGGFKAAGISDAAAYEKADYRLDRFEDILAIDF